ncbi:hypothetical protein P3W45_000635 [Vairimorpha bombi]
MDNLEKRNKFYEFELWRDEMLEDLAADCIKLEILGDNNLLHDKAYVDCDFLGKRIEGGKLLSLNADNSMLSTIKNINSGIKTLCDSNSDFENLLCEVYDLRDLCKNEPKCMGFGIKDVPKKYCKDNLYEYIMDEIGKIVGKKILKNIRDIAISNISNYVEEAKNDKDVPKCVEEYFLNSSDVIIKFDLENKPHLIIKRDLSNFNVPDMNSLIEEYDSLDSEFKMIGSTDIEKHTFYLMMSISIISSLLFFILVFLGYKDSKNRKIVVSTIVMTLFMLFISIYSTMMIID